ncbi:MAG: L,D-transpeptidase family protein [Chitinophagaceae bacterium]|nr:L,D-transpeptidase family protein [Chitinophagaceae bacterium]
MKTIYLKYVPVILLTCLLHYTSGAQIHPDSLRKFITGSRFAANKKIQEFYTALHYNTAWIGQHNTPNLVYFLDMLNTSPALGLQEKEYNFPFVRSFRDKKIQLQYSDDSLEAEIKFTETAIQFYTDLAYGNTKPSFGYNGLQYMPACHNIPALLAGSLAAKALPLLVAQISGTLPEIAILENKLRWFNSIIKDPGFSEVVIASNKVSIANQPLVKKLYQLGIIDNASNNLPDSLLKQKVKEAQIQCNLLPNGLLGAATLRELNTRLTARVEQVSTSLNYYRWLNCIVQIQPVITVNIPAAYLKVYDKNNVLLEMRVVVGKKSTPTPTLISTVDEVVLYPYWHVPYSIATKEILPILKRNPGYINTGNYQVLNTAGKIMDPYAVNWNSLSPSYFPYLIRQSTGCDNALGLLKLNFKNPFGVYLHDTNGKKYFSYLRRYLSHGCMRMQKPMEMGHLLLKNNSIAIDTLDQKGCLKNQSPIMVHATEHMPVIVWYNPAGIDSAGRLLFYEDVYRKFK